MKKQKFFMFGVILSIVMMVSGCVSEQPADIGVVVAPEPVRIAVLVTEGFHDGEAYMPIGYFTNLGAEITVIGPARGVVKAYNSDFTIMIEKTVEEVQVADFDALILPGGLATATLREDALVTAFTSDFFQTGKTVAAICHGPQVLAAAGVLEGKTSSGIGRIQEELEAAGATYVDEMVAIDGNLITSRVPGDLAAFCQAIESKLF